MTIIDNGAGNRLDLDLGVIADGSGTIVMSGNNSVVRIARDCVLINASLTVGTDCGVEVGASCRLAQLELYASASARVTIGPSTNFTGKTRIYLHEPGSVQIGANCMIAGDTIFTISDMHPLIDVASGARINPAADIVLGDKVWIGAEAAVLKGVTIGEGSAVGYRAVVTRSLPSFCLAVGAPARVIKRGVSWSPTL